MGMIDKVKKWAFPDASGRKEKPPRYFMRGVIDVEYGRVAKFYREKILRLTQGQFAEKYGITTNIASDFERGASNSDDGRDAYEKAGILRWARNLHDEVIAFLHIILKEDIDND